VLQGLVDHLMRSRVPVRVHIFLYGKFSLRSEMTVRLPLIFPLELSSLSRLKMLKALMVLATSLHCFLTLLLLLSILHNPEQALYYLPVYRVSSKTCTARRDQLYPANETMRQSAEVELALPPPSCGHWAASIQFFLALLQLRRTTGTSVVIGEVVCGAAVLAESQQLGY
jgi:hypothetical protein